jgi:hypothetical protein
LKSKLILGNIIISSERTKINDKWLQVVVKLGQKNHSTTWIQVPAGVQVPPGRKLTLKVKKDH